MRIKEKGPDAANVKIPKKKSTRQLHSEKAGKGKSPTIFAISGES